MQKKCNNGDYRGEPARSKVIRMKEHGGKDKQWWIFEHSSTMKHPRMKDDFEILALNFSDR